MTRRHGLTRVYFPKMYLSKVYFPKRVLIKTVFSASVFSESVFKGRRIIGPQGLTGCRIFGAFASFFLQTLGEKRGSLKWGGVQFTTKKVNESAKKKEEFYWDEKEVVDEPSATRGRRSITGIPRLGNANGAEKWRKVKGKEQAMRILGIGSNVNEAEGAKPV